MPIATGTALLIGAGISAGVQAYGAHKGAKAAEKAAAQQQEGVKEARAYAEPLYNQALQIGQQQVQQGQAGLAPYAQQGGQGLTALTALLGLPAGPAGGAGAGAASAPPAPSGPFGSRALTPQELAQIGPGPRTPGPYGGAPSGATVPLSQAASASSYVTLRAPTGETRAVPASQVESFLARGAQRV